jgi:hypothetical protein
MAKQSTQPPPFCIQCSGFIDETDPENGIGDIPRCRKLQMIDLVRGTPFYIPCSDARDPNAPCGRTGKMFQRKPFKIEIVEPASN